MYRRLIDGLVLVGLALVVGFEFGKAYSGPKAVIRADLIRAHSIELIDRSGHVCGDLFTDRQGAPWLTLQDARHPALISLTVGGTKNHARLVVSGGYHKPGIDLSSDDDTGRLAMQSGPRDGALSWLDVNSNGSTNLNLHPGSGPNALANLEVNGVPFGASGRAIHKST